MTVLSSTNRFDFVGNGSQTAFPMTNCLVLASGDVQVYVDAVLKVITTDYTLSGIGSPSGTTVTFLVAPASNAKVLCLRVVVATQGVDYVANDAFPAETHEQALDRLTMIGQQFLEQVGRAAKFKTTSLLTNPELPDGVTNTVLAWETNTKLQNLTLAQLGAIIATGVALPGYTLAGLPPAGTAGRQARVTDDVRGIRIDNASIWGWFSPARLYADQFVTGGAGTTASPWTGWDALLTNIPAGGATIELGHGDYRIPIGGLSGTTRRVAFRGVGKGATIFSYAGTGTALAWGSTASGAANAQFSIRDLTLSGTSSGAVGIDIIRLQDWYLENVEVLGFSAANAVGIRIRGSNSGVAINTDARSGNAIGLDFTVETDLPNLNTFFGGQITGNARAIRITSGTGNALYRLNIASTTTSPAVLLLGSVGNIIEANWFENNAGGAATSEIQLGDATNATNSTFIRHNTFTDANALTYLVRVFNGADNMIMANHFGGAAGQVAVRLESQSSKTYIGPNRYDATITPLSDASGTLDTFALGFGAGHTRTLFASTTLNFGSVAANSSAELTMSLTGAAAGDLIIAEPASALAAGFTWSAYVSAANVVTIRVLNGTTGAADPDGAGIVWRALAWKAPS